MFNIGDFARFGGVSVRTLRFYEELGLLRPAEVDTHTGYRSYEAHQLPRLHRIVALKDLGFTLEQLRPLLDRVSAEELQGMLLLKRAELEGRMAEGHALLARIENRLRYIAVEGQLAPDIVFKSLPELRVAGIRCEEPGLDFYSMVPLVRAAFGELRSRLSVAGVKLVNQSVFLFYEERPDGSLIPTVSAVIGDQSVLFDDRLIEVILPAADVASTVYEGPADHDYVGPIYGQLARWAEDHGYRVHGPGRDHFFGAPAADGTQVMELQLPLVLP